MTDELITRVEKHDYQQLFIRDLHWSAPDHPPITLTGENGQAVTATNVSSYHGIRVWVCGERPGPAVEAALDRLIAKTSTDRLVIFHAGDQQVWRWPVRRNKDNATSSRLTSHRHRKGSPNPKFAARLAAIRLPLDHTLDANSVLAKVRAAFDVETQNETKYASKLMARMYAALKKAYPGSFNSRVRDHQISVSLARILFLMFGDDTDMWTVDAFLTYVQQHTAADGTDIGARINALFDHLDTASPAAPPPELTDFPYVNGGIFNERVHLPKLNKEFRDAVLDACAVEWSDISPAIFGSMFQGVRDAQTRRELGEHYTSEENILKTLNPLFLDELRAEFERARTMKDEKGVLTRLWARLGEIRFMDPACGCGNFIIVSYRELRDLELAIMERLQEISGVAQLAFDPTLSLKITLDHFAGIEIDEWPARIAETAMFLIDRQCDLKLKDRFGDAPERLPIHAQSRIVVGNALRVDWAEIFPPSEHVVVGGNPPFIGARLKSDEQASDLRAAWGAHYDSDMDLVTGWHAKALKYYGEQDGRWALVTTNSICQGAAPAALFGPIHEAGWSIQFAHRTFPWTSEAAGAAAVHCVIVGFARQVRQPRLFVYTQPTAIASELPVSTINAYLVDAPWVLVSSRRQVLSPALTKCDFGSMANDGGHLLIDGAAHDELLRDPIASKYLRPFKGSEELVNNKERWCLWLEGASDAEIRRSRALRARVDAVRELRAASRRAATQKLAATPHLFGERRQPKTPYLCIPRHVSESRPYFTVDLFEPDVICGDANFAAEDPSGLLFAVMSSSMFMTWMRTIGGRLKSDLRFSSTVVWNNFPLPATSPEMRRQIIEAGALVLKARGLQSGVSLADLYVPGAMSAELIAAHTTLDRVVDAHFGIPGMSPTELERQDTLFARYQDLVAPLTSVTARGRRTR